MIGICDDSLRIQDFLTTHFIQFGEDHLTDIVIDQKTINLDRDNITDANLTGSMSCQYFFDQCLSHDYFTFVYLIMLFGFQLLEQV